MDEALCRRLERAARAQMSGSFLDSRHERWQRAVAVVGCMLGCSGPDRTRSVRRIGDAPANSPQANFRF